MNFEIAEVKINEINDKGLIGFASFVLDNSLYLGGISIFKSKSGQIKLFYPSKKSKDISHRIWHPINKAIASRIEEKVFEKLERIHG